MPATAATDNPEPDDLEEPELHPKYLKSEELGRKITEYSAWLNAGEYQWLSMVREFDQEGLWQLDGIHSCAHWLGWKCGIGMNAAREKVRVANALGDLPKVSAAFSKGKIGYSKVRAITRIATPENEEYLLNIARYGTAYHVEGLVAKYRRCKRLEDTKNAIEQRAKRELSYFYDDDGSFHFRGRFPAEEGELILKALELARERSDKEIAKERDHARAAAEKAEAQVSAETQDELDTTDDDAYSEGPYYSDPAEETRPFESFSARRADALTQLAETYLAHGPKATTMADRFQVVVHVSADTLKKEPTTPDNPPEVTQDRNPPEETPNGNPSAETSDFFRTGFSYIEQGPHVAAETARRIACDASKVRMTDDENGEPLNIGRKSRTIPPAMRRALRFRDDGCCYPGCTHKYHIDGHHIEHWADGGETSMENIVQLCRFHHGLVHEGGFGCQRTDDGTIVFTNPIGKEIGRSDYLSPIPDDGDPVDWLRSETGDLEIDAETGVTEWRGERMDWPLAVGFLFD